MNDAVHKHSATDSIRENSSDSEPSESETPSMVGKDISPGINPI